MYAAKQILICILSCVAAEVIFTKMRRRPLMIGDMAAIVTGMILAFSLPATAPWYIGVIASFAGIGFGKIVYGGLGMNIFNPAMVGRAFVMISFAGFLGASGYEAAHAHVDAITQATPMNVYKMSGIVTPVVNLFWGNTNGSIGETSSIACVLGGIYLILRRTASWQIPLSILLSVIVISGLTNLFQSGSEWTMAHDLYGGALMFGAFFIATDPVTSPLTSWGKVMFGAGIGCLTMVLRHFSGYPEGVMFAVLLMNAITPLINRMTIPKVFGEI